MIEFLISVECTEAVELLDSFTKELHHSVLVELDFLSETGEPQNPIPKNHKLVVKYTGNKCLVKTERLIRNAICECFDLKPWSLILDCVQEGCIALIYRISPAVKSHLLQYKTNASHIAMLKKFHIKCIIIDYKVLIPSGLRQRWMLFGLKNGKVATK